MSNIQDLNVGYLMLISNVDKPEKPFVASLIDFMSIIGQTNILSCIAYSLLAIKTKKRKAREEAKRPTKLRTF